MPQPNKYLLDAFDAVDDLIAVPGRPSAMLAYSAREPQENQTNDGQAAETYSSTSLALGAFGYIAGGWTSQNSFPRELADVNGDGRADVIGFGNGGVTVALATSGGGFAGPNLTLKAFGATAGVGGWSSNDR